MKKDTPIKYNNKYYTKLADEATEKIRERGIPIYGEDSAKELPTGMYIALFHGRSDLKMHMDDWGYDGPIIGPLKYCHTTYGSHIALGWENENDEERLNNLYFGKGDSNTELEVYRHTPHPELSIQEDLIDYQGMYYGDWTVFCHNVGENK